MSIWVGRIWCGGFGGVVVELGGVDVRVVGGWGFWVGWLGFVKKR